MIEIEPTAEFHASLMRRVEETGRVEETRRVEKAAGEFTPELKIGPASKRLEKMVARYDATTAWFRPAWKIGVFAASAAACMLMAMSAHYFIVTPEPSDPNGSCPPIASQKFGTSHKRAMLSRYVERTNPLAVKTTTLTDNKIELNQFAEDEELVITSVIDLENNEKCIMAFRSEEWREYLIQQRNLAKNGKESKRIAALKEESQIIPVVDGYITLPEGMLAEYLGTRELKVLQLAGRTELWESESYKTYCKNIPNAIRIQLDTPI